MATNQHISFLLGAGFSVPMGYPIGNGMNQNFLEFDKYFVDPLDGQIVSSPTANSPNNHYEMALRFCKKAILFYYSHNNGFDYELFYDIIIRDMAKADKASYYQQIAESVVSQSSGTKWFQLITDFEVIYNRLVAFFLKDDKHRQWYQGDELLADDEIEKYQTFFQILSVLSEDHIVHVHTLNHDLVLEAFNETHSNLLRKSISDGFSVRESNYGTVYRDQDVSKTEALEEYTGEYNSDIRLYKLHGSLNYWKFYNHRNGAEAKPERMLKLKRGESPEDLFRIDPVTKEWVSWPFEYCPSFLTGTTLKERQYHEFFFNDLLLRFIENLEKSEMLVVVGYGFKDDGINTIIEEYFDCEKKKVIVIDPFLNSNETIKSFVDKWNAVSVEKSISKINMEDILHV